MNTKITLIIFCGLFLSACNAGRDQTNIELIQGMMDQVSVKSQDYDAARGEAGMRVPPEGTIPRNFTPYKYKGAPLKAEAQLRNPFARHDLFERGKERYVIYCGVCHGAGGAGDGSIAEKMPLKPPSLLTSKVRNFRDGRIFHIITDGQGVMGSYANQLPQAKDRWAIVNYVRHLQRNGDN